MPLLADEVRWGRTTIPYRYVYAKRKTLAITVHPDLTVAVAAPEGVPLAAIRGRVRKRAPWIRTAWREFELYLPKQPPRRYVSGETHRYLGRQYRLKVRPAREESVKLERGYLSVTCSRGSDSETVRRLVQEWYQRHAEHVFDERLQVWAELLKRKRIPTPAMRVRRLAKRWGSCAPSGEIILNVELVKAPKDCIDYVIAHELCHLSERNHSRRFWRLMDHLMPDWKNRRMLLNQMADV
jgi:predicted metal-dependent hydrolase